MTTQTFLQDSIGPYLFKAPVAELDYEFDWTEWLAGDQISAAEVTADGLTVGSVTHTGTVVTVWLSGGAAEATVTVTCVVHTVGDRHDERSFRLKIRPR